MQTEQDKGATNRRSEEAKKSQAPAVNKNFTADKEEGNMNHGVVGGDPKQPVKDYSKKRKHKIKAQL